MARAIRIALAILAAAAVLAGPARAADQAPAAPPAENGKATADAGDQFDVSIGAALTSDYMFRGITQTDHKPALQPYIEPSYGIFYAGVWASNVDYLTPEPDVEVDLYAGVRPELGPLSADLSYLYYLYPGATEGDYSELNLRGTLSPTDMFSLGGEVDYAWDYANLGDDSLYFEANGSVTLPHDISLSAAVGYQTYGSGLGLSDYLTWNIGASYTWKAVTFDLRYHDTDLSETACAAEYPRGDACDARIVATVTVATSLSALRSNN